MLFRVHGYMIRVAFMICRVALSFQMPPLIVTKWLQNIQHVHVYNLT